MRVEQAVDVDSHLWQTWKHYRETDDFTNTRRWVEKEAYRDSSLWAVYERGYRNGASTEGGCDVIGVAIIASLCTVVGFVAGQFV